MDTQPPQVAPFVKFEHNHRLWGIPLEKNDDSYCIISLPTCLLKLLD